MCSSCNCLVYISWYNNVIHLTVYVSAQSVFLPCLIASSSIASLPHPLLPLCFILHCLILHWLILDYLVLLALSSIAVFPLTPGKKNTFSAQKNPENPSFPPPKKPEKGRKCPKKSPKSLFSRPKTTFFPSVRNQRPGGCKSQFIPVQRLTPPRSNPAFNDRAFFHQKKPKPKSFFKNPRSREKTQSGNAAPLLHCLTQWLKHKIGGGASLSILGPQCLNLHCLILYSTTLHCLITSSFHLLCFMLSSSLLHSFLLWRPGV